MAASEVLFRAFLVDDCAEVDGSPEGGGMEGDVSPVLTYVRDEDLEVRGAWGDDVGVVLVL